MAGGSLPRGGKAERFRRLSEAAPPDLRTRITEFIDSVAFKDDISSAAASAPPPIPAAHDHDKYALKDHSHGQYALKGHTHPESDTKPSINNLAGVDIKFPEARNLLRYNGMGGWENAPPEFWDSKFNLRAASDLSKRLEFDVSALTTKTTRIAAAVDAPMTIPPTSDWTDLTDGGLTYLHTHDHDYLYGAGYYTHDEIDDHINDATVHFTEDSIHHPEPVTVAISPGTPVILGDDVVVTGLAPAIQTYAEGDFELVFLASGEVVTA